MFSQLTNVTIYNSANEAVCHKSTGFLIEKKTHNSFDTRLHLSTPKFAKLKAGESYYAVGTKENGGPVRSETVICVVPGPKPIFEGSIPFLETPKDFKPGLSAGSDADILIQYVNFSSTQFQRSTWGFNLQTGFGYPTNSPGPILLANSGQQSIGAAQRLGWFDEGPADIYLCWASGSNFGVWIHFNFRMWGIGPRPIWYVTTNGSAWALAGGDASDPYTWDSSALGYNVVGTPTSGSASLTVNVTITDVTE
jgi:hypothetical protein